MLDASLQQISVGSARVENFDNATHSSMKKPDKMEERRQELPHYSIPPFRTPLLRRENDYRHKTHIIHIYGHAHTALNFT